MNPGDPVLYFPASGGSFEGVFQGFTVTGWIRIQLTLENGKPIGYPRLAITTPNRVRRIESETGE